ncbi:MAG TPA: hypothetical protein VFA94_07145 [Acidimicrobiales bacterium]|nr:hypothetical protein [Acidimicrobiales bacterium]
MTTPGAPSKAELELRAWLDELPALGAALDTTPDARKVLLEDAAADTWLLDQAPNAHPVVLARSHLAHAAIQSLLDDGDAAVEHARRAVDLGSTLAAPGPRLAILAQGGALAAGTLGKLRAARRREVQHMLVDVAEAAAEAYAEQAELSRRGVATLTAALALVDSSTAVRGAARDAVRSRARALAVDARADLARAGEVAKARLASETIATLDGKRA